MRLYADTTGRLGRQLFSDVFVLVWLIFWTWLATKLYDLVVSLGVPGEKLASAGDGIANGLRDAGSQAHRVPVAGDALSEPFSRAAQSARGLADAGREQVTVVHEMAWVLALLLLAVPVAVVLFGWLPWRLRWVRRASSAVSLRDGTAGRDLLALRALATQPLRRLSTVDDDPVGAWRRGDPDVLDRLAGLELRHLGLHT
jgi:hypothetical protein